MEGGEIESTRKLYTSSIRSMYVFYDVLRPRRTVPENIVL